MWKYGFRLYENKDSVGPAFVNIDMEVSFEPGILFRKVNGSGIFTLYYMTQDKQRVVMEEMYMGQNMTYCHEHLFLPENATLYLAIQGVKKKEKAMLARRIGLSVHRTSKSMVIVDDRFLLTRDHHDLTPTDVFNHRWK